jgi:hypothetical protein
MCCARTCSIRCFFLISLVRGKSAKGVSRVDNIEVDSKCREFGGVTQSSVHQIREIRSRSGGDEDNQLDID